MGYELPQVRVQGRGCSMKLNGGGQGGAAGSAGECPYVNLEDSRCSEHLTLSDMGYAFEHCFAEFGGCEVYRVISSERDGRGEAEEGKPEVFVAEQVGDGALTPCIGETAWRRWRVRLANFTIGRGRRRSGKQGVAAQRRAG